MFALEVFLINPVFSILLTAGASAIAAGVFALLGIWIGSRNEYKKWLRERKHETYIQFLIETQPLSVVAFLPTTVTGVDVDRWELDKVRSAAYAKLMVVASNEVAEAAIDLYNDIKSSHSVVKEFLDEAPDQLEIIENAITEALSEQDQIPHEAALEKLAAALPEAVAGIATQKILQGFDLIMLKHQLLTQMMRVDLKMPILKGFRSPEAIRKHIIEVGSAPAKEDSI